jgi:protein-glutamine gamma-glutamyltransferase
MRIPPLLLAAALLFWGWQTDLLHFAILLALALELPRVVAARWDFSDTDLRRVRDLCAILMIGASAYTFFARDGTNEILEFFRATNYTTRNRMLEEAYRSAFLIMHWLPLMTFPLIAAQAWSSAQSLPSSIYSYILQRRRQGQPPRPLAEGRFDASWAYFVLVLVCTSTAPNRYSTGFYAGLCVLIALALWSIRPRRAPGPVWVALLALVIVTGHFGHTGIRHLQGYLDSAITHWISGLRREPSRTESRTAIGQIGRLKLSGKIVYRATDWDGPPPMLIRDASYNGFREPVWFIVDGERDEQTAPPNDEDPAFRTYTLSPDTRPHAITLTTQLPRRAGILAVPNGAAEVVFSVVIGEMRTNRFGVVSVSDAPGLLRFTTRHGPGAGIDSPPTSDDLSVPAPEGEAITNLVRELAVRRLPPDQRVRVIANFFARDFSYTTWLDASRHQPPSGQTALSHFLTTSRSGHCEYFATGTVLLLRAAGIPARYANGYSVQERKGDQFVIRERHAHAWTLFWDESSHAWRDLDTTPGGWEEVEKEANASVLEPVKDFFSNLWHEFSLWRWTGDNTALRRYLLLAIVLLVIVLAWRLIHGRKRAKKTTLRGAGVEAMTRQGIDSAFYEIERRLAALGLERRPEEPLGHWLDRVERLGELPVAPLRPLLALHYRYRFDPRGLEPEELARLAAGARQWLATASSFAQPLTNRFPSKHGPNGQED